MELIYHCNYDDYLDAMGKHQCSQSAKLNRLCIQWSLPMFKRVKCSASNRSFKTVMWTLHLTLPTQWIFANMLFNSLIIIDNFFTQGFPSMTEFTEHSICIICQTAFDDGGMIEANRGGAEFRYIILICIHGKFSKML